MEVGKRTAEYLVHCLLDDLKELIYTRSAFDMDGNLQFVEFVVLIGSGMFGEGKKRLDESKISDQANGFTGTLFRTTMTIFL